MQRGFFLAGGGPARYGGTMAGELESNESVLARLAPGAFAPIDYAAALNEDQLAAVTAPPGPALVLAGAGSGKTRTLTYRVAWLLEQGAQPWQILLLTFTNKAAREMLGRVEDLTGVPRARFWGGTFHSVGQRVLRRHGEAAGLAPNYTILDEGDADALFGDVIRAVDPGLHQAQGTSEAARHRRRHQLRAQHAPDARRGHRRKIPVAGGNLARNCTNLPPPTSRPSARSRSPITTTCSNTGCRCCNATRPPAPIIKNNSATSSWTNTRTRTSCSRKSWTSSPPSTSSWPWATTRSASTPGAARTSTTSAASPSGIPGAQIFKIEINYRSTPEVLRFANGILDHQHVAEGFHKHLRPVRKMGRKPVSDRRAGHADSRPTFVITRIREAARRIDGVALRDIAVLYRAHYQAMDLQIELSRAGVPFTITSGVRFFEQAHVRDLTAHLRFAHNPRDTVAFIRLASLLPKVGPRKAESALAAAQQVARAQCKSLIGALTNESVALKLPAEARADFKDLALTLQNLEEALARLGVAQLHPEQPSTANLRFSTSNEMPRAHQGSLWFETEAPIPQSAIRNQQLAPSPAEVVRIAIEGWYGDYMRNIYDNWETRREDLESIIGFASRFADMNELLAQLVLLNSETSDRAVEPDADTVRLTTIHQAKGLEFPVVFIIGAADGLLPLKRAIDSGDVEEERRLFYVAATRARDELYVLYPRIVSQGGPPAVLEPSRFIEELDPESFDQFKAKTGLY